MSQNQIPVNDDLLIKFLLGETSPEETEAVNSWLRASEGNLKEYHQLKQAWEKSRTGPLPDVDENAAWRRFQARVHMQEAKPVRRSLPWLRIAAIFLVICCAGWFLIRFSGQPEMKTAEAAGTVRIDTLSDGSIVTLNKNSSLHYPSRFTGKSRKVSLEGEAFFQITPDKTRPFTIDVNEITVKVVGTSFNIRSVNGITEVIVETGIVQVIKGGQLIELRPGQRTVDSAGSVLKASEVKDRLYNHYRTKEFVCDNTPLKELAVVLSEAYGKEIVIERAELRNLPLNVTFSNESLDVILDLISETFNDYRIQIIKKENKIILR